MAFSLIKKISLFCSTPAVIRLFHPRLPDHIIPLFQSPARLTTSLKVQQFPERMFSSYLPRERAVRRDQFTGLGYNFLITLMGSSCHHLKHAPAKISMLNS